MTSYLLGTWLFSVFLCVEFMHGLVNVTLHDHVHMLLALPTHSAIYQGQANLTIAFRQQ